MFNCVSLIISTVVMENKNKDNKKKLGSPL